MIIRLLFALLCFLATPSAIAQKEDAAMPKKNGAYITATAPSEAKHYIMIHLQWLVRLLLVIQINMAELVLL